MIFMHLHGFGGGVGGPGGPKNIENPWISSYFDCVGNGVKGRAAPDSLKIKGFPYICMVSAVGWAALADQGSLEMY